MTGEDLAAARDLFLAYDGSRQSMWRDGEEERYLAFGVPAEVEAAWFEELLQERLVGLRQPGNWRSVAFLAHHRRVDELDRIAAVEPLGEWWERCAFLESLLRYVEFVCPGHHPPQRLAELCRFVAERAAMLDDTIPADQPPDRVTRLLARASAVEATFNS